MKTAIVIGATGLIGRQLVSKLLDDNRYEIVKTFVRRSSMIHNAKLQEHVIDFDRIEKWKNELTGDELFSALGTTIKQAGGKDAQYKIDYTYQYEIAKAAAHNSVQNYILVSSYGANSKSRNFYLKIKGELEEAARSLPFQKIIIFQPSLLIGERREKRAGESIAAFFSVPLTNLIPPLKKYRPIEAATVAQAMINSANKHNANRLIIYTLSDIFDQAS
ncbi:MAG: NAD(P)H-binding protein [Bacteroidetes bacterium]|nr:NAD(P)H-binding protein [Bacteroidota bacterium]MCL6098119.1 NAD(P)H-binding protein [Bacteroidota bacterium]